MLQIIMRWTWMSVNQISKPNVNLMVTSGVYQSLLFVNQRITYQRQTDTQTDIAISKSKPRYGWKKKDQTYFKDFRTCCIIILTLSSWPLDREGKRSNARCLPESPHLWDWETQWQEDELTVGHCRAINQDRQAAVSQGTEVVRHKEASHLPACHGIGWPHSMRLPLSRPLSTVSRWRWKDLPHLIMTCYLALYFANMFFCESCYFKCLVLQYSAKSILWKQQMSQ